MIKTIQTKAGILTLLEDWVIQVGKQFRRMVKLRCFCGKYFITRKDTIKNGIRVSCGCFNHLTKHGYAAKKHRNASGGSPTYQSWLAMKVNTRVRYAEKGIKIYDKWKSFIGFLEDMGEKPLEHKFSRIDKEGDFEPDNYVTKILP
jgi:hypothetical protein